MDPTVHTIELNFPRKETEPSIVVFSFSVGLLLPRRTKKPNFSVNYEVAAVELDSAELISSLHVRNNPDRRETEDVLSHHIREEHATASPALRAQPQRQSRGEAHERC